MADRPKQDTSANARPGNPLGSETRAQGYKETTAGTPGKAGNGGLSHGSVGDGFTVEAIPSVEKSTPFPSSLSNWGTAKWPSTKGGER
jgi:hypothetical protein